ncbi:MAG: helix-turn-helix domain-containing protein [Rhodobacteraceae bacterium]|nr:helix-turn-helix domain-containing protein [Paracoccaceae bacterium]
METTVARVPGWVPDEARRYLAHTALGLSLRALGRREAMHPSTVLRQVRKIETRRDDPMVDRVLDRLAELFLPEARLPTDEEIARMQAHFDPAPMPDTAKFEREALRVLRRLCEPGAVLAVAQDMEKAVVVREQAGQTERTATVDPGIVEAMALKEWLSCDAPGRISRYHVTAAGRGALNRLLAAEENRATGFAEAQAGFANPHLGEGLEAVGGAMGAASRFSVADSPLVALARRRDRDGSLFLNADQVWAGERLREDYELAQMGGVEPQDWLAFLEGSAKGRMGKADETDLPGAARGRVEDALTELGEGLADVALRCCCFLEGLERTEKRLGWSARSGKIVLRIALTRLNEYYRSQAGGVGPMIG